MRCNLCNAKLVRVWTNSAWEFDLWCPRCEKRVGTESFNHAWDAPREIEAYDEPPKKEQGDLF